VNLTAKYGPEPTSSAAAPQPQNNNDHASRLMRFYKKYDAEKATADQIKKVLDKYAGREDQLWENLTMKYGPEP
jgi:hypothetical protein